MSINWKKRVELGQHRIMKKETFILDQLLYWINFLIRSLLQIGILCEVQIEKEKPYYYISPPSERHSAEPVWKRFNYDGKQPTAGESKGRGSIRTLVLFLRPSFSWKLLLVLVMTIDVLRRVQWLPTNLLHSMWRRCPIFLTAPNVTI